MKEYHNLSEKEQIRLKNHFYSLVQMAYADNQLDVNELKFLREQGQKYGLPEKELANILNENSHKTDISKHGDPYEKIELLYDLIRIMLIDHELAAEEVSLCMKIAKCMKIDPGYIPDFVDTVEDHIKKDKNIDDLIDEFYNKF